MTTPSRSVIASNVGLSSSETSSATSNSGLSPPSPASPVPPPGAEGLPLLQAVRARCAATLIPLPASACVRRLSVAFLCCDADGSGRSVGGQLRHEVLGAGGLRVGEA